MRVENFFVTTVIAAFRIQSSNVSEPRNDTIDALAKIINRASVDKFLHLILCIKHYSNTAYLSIRLLYIPHVMDGNRALKSTFFDCRFGTVQIFDCVHAITGKNHEDGAINWGDFSL